MAAMVADVRSIPPGYRFKPTDKELVEFFLLPRARGLPDPVPGVDITEDDTAASTRPWKLFERHNRDEKDELYFWVRGNDAKPGARRDRLVDGGYKWRNQRRVPGVLDVGGEKVKWTKHILSLQRSDSDSGSGSLGWVMHEYVIAKPNCGHVKICHIAFTGHGQKRKRVPEEFDAGESEPKSHRAHIAAAAASHLDDGTRKAFNQGTEQILAFNQEAQQDYGAMEQEHLQGESFYLGEIAPQLLHFATAAPSSSSVMASQFDQETEQVPTTASTMEHMGDEHCQDGSTPHSSSGGSRTMATMSCQGSGASAQGHQDPSDVFISEMVEELTGSFVWNDQVWTSEQQVENVTVLPPVVQESGTANNGCGSPRFCGMPDTAARALNGELWGGYGFC